MATPADEAEPTPTPRSKSVRQARALRTEQEIRDQHTPETAELLIALRRMLVHQFGETGCFQQLAMQIRADLGESEKRTSRQIAKRLSDQMGNRSESGPPWTTIELVLRHCVSDDDRSSETNRLLALHRAARGNHKSGSNQTAERIDRDGDTTEVTALRAELSATRQELEKAFQQLERAFQQIETLDDDRAVALRAAGKLTTRAAELERMHTEAALVIEKLSNRVEHFRHEHQAAVTASIGDRAELRELREKLARIVAFLESDPSLGNVRVGTSALTSTAQSVGISPISNAAPAHRLLATYLRVRAELEPSFGAGCQGRW